MLLDDVNPTHEWFDESLSKANDLSRLETYESGDPDAIDPFVKERLGSSCGYLYKPLMKQLKQYPMPDIRVPEGHGKSLLDIGCMWGRWTISARRKGYLAVGVDPGLEAARAARRVATQLGADPIHVVADGRNLPFKCGTFDVVYSYSVLQHFERADALACLEEIARVLAASGTSLIQLAHRIGLISIVRSLRKRSGGSGFGRVKSWSIPEMQREFGRIIGPTRTFVDGFFTLNPQTTDLQLLPFKSRAVTRTSEFLRKTSTWAPFLKYVADSIYVQSTPAEPAARTEAD
jgi:SAM-dependent methyltransferase